MHVAPQGFTVSGPQKLLGCTVGAAVPNPNPPAGASRSRACPAVPARGPWVRLVTQCDAKNRISPDSQLSAPKLPAPPHAATANKKEVLPGCQAPSLVPSKESCSPGNSCRPRSQGTVVPSLRHPPSAVRAAAVSGRPQQGGRVVPTAPASS